MGKPAGLAKEQRRTLDRLKQVPGLDRFYLAGGSAIAVHLHHRRSLDLDLFSLSPSIDLSAIAEAARGSVPNVRISASATPRSVLSPARSPWTSFAIPGEGS